MYSILLFLSTLCGVINPAATPDCSLRYDGVYRCELEDQKASRYIRCYEDGTLLLTDSPSSLKELALWFKRGDEDVIPHTTWKLKQCNLSFQLKNQNGKFKYKGSTSGDTIVLTKTDADGHDHEERYTFIPLSLR